uniref:non-specific serine/threonine protein kinase n=1 Tax=Kalanchoe fedtschenkoi TaxID=63787 RepID=A0A7N1A3L7_KALFE
MTRIDLGWKREYALMAAARRRSESLLVILSCFLLATFVRVHAQSQTGFISLDCGSSTSYADSVTGIQYVPDTSFIDSGESKNVAATYNLSNLEKPLANVRSFPEGVRNCYTLRPQVNTVNGTRFLVRARFMYGNYDSMNRAPEFDLYIGVNLWASISFDSVSGVTTEEMIHVTTSNVTFVCLVNKGLGTPFISVLEMRVLDDDAYVTKLSGSLSLVHREYMGSGSEYRFADDVYDRIWKPAKRIQGTTYLSSNESVVTSNGYQPPQPVMRTALTSSNPTSNLNFSVAADLSTDKYYFYMHFAELQNLTGLNQTRQFNIFLNNNLFFGPITPVYRSTITVLSVDPQSAQQFNFSLRRTANSTLPPMLNAFEVYKLNPLSQAATDATDVGAVNSIKSSYGVTKLWQGDPCAPQNSSWEGLGCSFSGVESPRIIALNLSSSGLTGPISSSISNLKALERLDLSKNNLSGPVPEFLSSMTSLKFLNLSGNNFTGTVPVTLVTKSNEGFLTLSVEGNRYLCLSEPCNQSRGKSSVVVPVVSSVAGVIVLVLIVVAAFYIYRKKKSKGEEGQTDGTGRPLHNGSRTRDVVKPNKQQFTYSEILSITNNFQKVIGTGGFGTVYHGQLDDVQVAVKMVAPSSSQGYKEFEAESQILTRVHHRNLTSLIGYCDEGAKLGLIYEFMANGSLESHISDKNPQYLLWEDRLHIAIDAAQGLDYLHNGCRPPIVHRDVKTTNILLTETFQAKLADFGLSRVYPADGGTQQAFTVVAGTPGYLDPEYYRTQRLNEKSDVYSFGVVLLEIITSQPMRARSEDRTHISVWVKEVLSTTGDIKSIVDARLQGDYDMNSAWKAIELAMSCVSSASINRPTMSQVVMELKQCLEMEVARKMGGYTKDTIESSDLLSWDSNSEQPLAR